MRLLNTRYNLLEYENEKDEIIWYSLIYTYIL